MFPNNILKDKLGNLLCSCKEDKSLFFKLIFNNNNKVPYLNNGIYNIKDRVNFHLKKFCL